MLGTQEILLIALVILLLFGGKKIPELMKGMGKGVKSFKDGMNGIDSPSDTTHSSDSADSVKADSATKDSTTKDSATKEEKK